MRLVSSLQWEETAELLVCHSRTWPECGCLPAGRTDVSPKNRPSLDAGLPGLQNCEERLFSEPQAVPAAQTHADTHSGICCCEYRSDHTQNSAASPLLQHVHSCPQSRGHLVMCFEAEHPACPGRPYRPIPAQVTAASTLSAPVCASGHPHTPGPAGRAASGTQALWASLPVVWGTSDSSRFRGIFLHSEQPRSLPIGGRKCHRSHNYRQLWRLFLQKFYLHPIHCVGVLF